MPAHKLSRKSAPRKRLLRNLATSLVLYEKVETTEAKAKAVLPVVERLITKARQNTLAARRAALATLFDPNAVQKLFEDFPARYGSRTSGFVRLTKLPARKGDGSAMAQLELVLTPMEEIIAAEEAKKPAKAAKTEKKESK